MPELSQEEYDELIDNQRTTKFLLQEIKDLLEGRIRSANITEYKIQWCLMTGEIVTQLILL